MRKNLTKKLFLSVLTLAFAVISLGASTYAWFTMSKEANVDKFTGKVTSTESGLEICATDLTVLTADVPASKWQTTSLNLLDVLIALAITASTNPAAELALNQLEKLKGLQLHSSVMLSGEELKTINPTEELINDVAESRLKDEIEFPSNIIPFSDENRIYDFFVNYFETMLTYMDSSKVFFNILTSAKLFFDILNINFSNAKIKDAMIRIKMHRGEDTYAYLLNLLDDYKEKRISEKTFIDILNTIDEYLINRKNQDENINQGKLKNLKQHNKFRWRNDYNCS